MASKDPGRGHEIVGGSVRDLKGKIRVLLEKGVGIGTFPFRIPWSRHLFYK